MEQVNKILETILTEGKQGYLEPTSKPPDYFITLFCVPKKPKPHQTHAWRVVRHGSFYVGLYTSINQWIDPVRSSMKDLPTPLPNLESYIRLFFGQKWLAGRDLQDAFRQILLHFKDAKRIGYAICGLYFYDRRQPYGIRSAAANCQHFASIIIWIFEKYKIDLRLRGQTTAYIDDYTMTAKTKQDIIQMATAFDRLLDELGVIQSLNKVIAPTQEAEVYGFHWNLREQTVTIPPKKRRELQRALAVIIFLRIATVRALESLVGKLMHWCQLHKSAKALCYNSIHFIYEWIRSKNVPKTHYVFIPLSIVQDFKYWLEFIRHLPPIPFTTLLHQPQTTIYGSTDASDTHGGVIVGGQWFSYPFSKTDKTLHINCKEGHALLMAVHNFRHSLSGKQILIHIDNQAFFHAFRRRWSAKRRMMLYIYELCLISLRYKCVIWLQWIRSAINIFADSLSRDDLTTFHNTAKCFNPPISSTAFQYEYFGKNQFILDTAERLESAKAYDNFVRRATTSNGPIPVTWLSKREKKIWPKLAEFHSINDFYSPQELRT